MTLVSHRFHALILRILQTRLFNAAGLKDHKLILECFHPSTKLSTPYLFCDYLGTGRCDAGSDELGFDGKSYNEGMGVEMGLGDLRGLYSHFRPLQPDEDRPRNRRHPAGGVLPNPSPFLQEREAEFVEQPINLESHELFSQLCTITNLVKVGPKRGLFLSCVNIGEGITRIWREWLGERARAGKRRERIGSGPNTKAEEEAESRKRLLWADAGSHVGLRIRVMECADAAMPVLVGSDEDVAVSYTLQYEGMFYLPKNL
jgi:hypothetical protein